MAQEMTQPRRGNAIMGVKPLVLAGAKVLVVGLGVSGLWSARVLARRGAQVTVSERRSEMDLDPGLCAELRQLGVSLETGSHRNRSFLDADLIVISPGVPHHHEAIEAARRKGIRVLGELEVASRLTHTPMIAVTGTNGKSTVTTHIGALLKEAGFKVFVGGNLGTPYMAYAGGTERVDYAVLEVSSFQLDTIETFSPLVSILLNITPDHLDRYESFVAYGQSKLRVFENQGPGTFIILCDDDERLSGLRPAEGPTLLRYGLTPGPHRHAYAINEAIRAGLGLDSMMDFPLRDVSLPGRHNRQNLMAVILSGLALGLDPSLIQSSLKTLKGLSHRMESVGVKGGVLFVDDSKATNVDAAIKAVEAFDRPLILIAGGRHKGAEYTPLVQASRNRVKGAVFLGESKDLLAAAFEGSVPFALAQDMEEAVLEAFAAAQPGDLVLLAPACSSFDMFSDYAERGRAFQAAVGRIAHG